MSVLGRLVVLSIVSSAPMLAGCRIHLRATNNVRTDDGDVSRIPITQTHPGSTVEWKIVSQKNAWKEGQTFEEAKNEVETDDNLSATSRGEGTTALLPKGDYGEAYFLRVIETVATTKDEKTDKDDKAKDVEKRRTVQVIDDRDPALPVGSHLGLLFIPELDGMLEATQFSFYPGRKVAIPRRNGVNIAWLADGFSLDAGIAGASVSGDPPPELAGRIAVTLGVGLTFAPGWAIKGGALLYRDATEDDDLTDAVYWGISYDLLKGLTKK